MNVTGVFWFRPHLRLASAVGCRRESSAGYLDIEGEEAMSVFGGSEGDAEESQGKAHRCKKAPDETGACVVFCFDVCVIRRR